VSSNPLTDFPPAFSRTNTDDPTFMAPTTSADSSSIHHFRGATCSNLAFPTASLNAVDSFPHSWAPSYDTLAADDFSVSSEDTCRVNNLKSASSMAEASYSSEDTRAQLDTGAMVTCTNLLHILHDFRYYSYDSKFPCTTRLTGAIDKSVEIFPLGEGSLHVPAINRQGFVAIKCLYSPLLSSTLLSENYILLTSEDSETGYSGQTIDKSFTKNRSTGNFSLIYHHKLRRRQDILLHGIIVAGQCYTHPLRLPDLPIDHPLTTIYISSEWLLVMILNLPRISLKELL